MIKYKSFLMRTSEAHRTLKIKQHKRVRKSESETRNSKEWFEAEMRMEAENESDRLNCRS